MDLNFIISLIIGFIVAIIFSLKRVKIKLISISLYILLKFNEKKRNKLIKKAIFSTDLKEKTKAIDELIKMKSTLLHRKLIRDSIKFLAIYAIITLIILLTIGYIINSIFKSPFSYISGWFIGFIVMIIKNKFF